MNTTLYQSPIITFIPTDTQSTYASVHINTDMQTKVVLAIIIVHNNKNLMENYSRN